jgi:hypothetical protein
VPPRSDFSGLAVSSKRSRKSGSSSYLAMFAQFGGDIHGHVSGPALVGIEGDDAGRMSLESNQW